MTRRKRPKLLNGNAMDDSDRVSTDADDDPTDDEFDEEEEAEPEEEEEEEEEASDDSSGSRRRRESTASPTVEVDGERSPIRCSHKLAERQRRRDMSELFEQLKSSLPAEDSFVKPTKGRLLLKAVSYVAELERSIGALERAKNALAAELDGLKRNADSAAEAH